MDTTLLLVSSPGIVALSAVSVFFAHADNTPNPMSTPTANFVIALPSKNCNSDLNTNAVGKRRTDRHYDLMRNRVCQGSCTTALSALRDTANAAASRLVAALSTSADVGTTSSHSSSRASSPDALG